VFHFRALKYVNPIKTPTKCALRFNVHPRTLGMYRPQWQPSSNHKLSHFIIIFPWGQCLIFACTVCFQNLKPRKSTTPVHFNCFMYNQLSRWWWPSGVGTRSSVWSRQRILNHTTHLVWVGTIFIIRNAYFSANLNQRYPPPSTSPLHFIINTRK
jgi:hypothetical protein